MMGKKKPSDIRKEIRAAFVADGLDAIPHVESEIHKAERRRKVDPTELESLFLLRDALAKAVRPKKRKPVRTSRGRV